MTTEFDQRIQRRHTSSTKWTKYSPEVLPFWVADTDFAAPKFVLDAITQRTQHGIIGYTVTPDSIVEAFQSWLRHHYGWQVEHDWLVWLPGVVPGLNLAAKAAMRAKGGVLIPSPVYYPFFDVPTNSQGKTLISDLVLTPDGWRMNFDELEQLAPDADMLLLSNPQNPTGRAYTKNELQQLADLCAKHDLVLISDEIHSAIILDEHCSHTPVAPLNPQLKSISLYAPTKTYNIPGLSCAVAVIPDAQLRERFLDARAGLVSSPGPLAYAACEAAFNDRSGWVASLTAYLRSNRDLLAEIAGDRMAHVEATYLGWIDVRDLGLQDVEAHFLKHGLGLSMGTDFGGEGFVRFNFACPRSLLEQGMQRLEKALSG